MNNLILIEKLKDIEANYKTTYMWGVFGSPVSEKIIKEKSKQYPSWYTDQKQRAFRKLISENYFAFDCVNLIKGILWGWNADRSKYNGGAVYNASQDVSANGLKTKLLDLSRDFSVIELGEAVWMNGHVGVYIGDGKVIECSPKWANGVQITACLNVGPIAGLNGRHWEAHGKIPWVQYIIKANEDDSIDLPDWQKKIIEDGLSLRVFSDCEKWTKDINKPIPAWAAIAMVTNSHKALLKEIKGGKLND